MKTRKDFFFNFLYIVLGSMLKIRPPKDYLCSLQSTSLHEHGDELVYVGGRGILCLLIPKPPYHVIIKTATALVTAEIIPLKIAL